MPEKLLAHSPEVFVSTTATSLAASRALKAGKLRKLGSRLYTSNLNDEPAAIVRRNLWPIVGGYFPGGLIADRTALENAPAADGSVFLVTTRGEDIVLPGLRLRPRRGAWPLPSDRPFIGGLTLRSIARATPKNMRPSRARQGTRARTLSRGKLEERLDTLLRRSGADAFRRLRDDIRAIAPALALDAEAQALDQLMGTLLGTYDAPLSSPVAKARSKGRPYDPDRLTLFETLRKTLSDYPPRTRIARPRSGAAQTTIDFFDAYFSHFIEGRVHDVPCQRGASLCRRQRTHGSNYDERRTHRGRARAQNCSATTTMSGARPRIIALPRPISAVRPAQCVASAPPSSCRPQIERRGTSVWPKSVTMCRWVPLPCRSSTGLDGTVRLGSRSQIMSFCCSCRPTPRNSIRRKISGNICAAIISATKSTRIMRPS